MKLLRKEKDYYDYIIGLYGIDELMIYDRRSNLIKLKDIKSYNQDKEPQSIKIAICNKIYQLYLFQNKIYHTVEDLYELFYKINNLSNTKLNYNNKNKSDGIKLAQNRYDRYNIYTDVNIKFRQPVLIQNENNSEYTNCRVPLLSSFNMAKYLDAKELYEQIIAFLGYLNDHPEIPNKQTDKEKIITHGFDIKTSFRNIK